VNWEVKVVNRWRVLWYT